MKYKARFVIPNVSAEKIGVNLTSTYLVDVVSDKNPFLYVNILEGELKNTCLLVEQQTNVFKEYCLVISGWMNHNYWTQDSYLFQGAIELFSTNDKVL